MAAVELRVTSVAAGGEGVAREPSGRVVFVRGALPGEAVLARIVESRDRFARAVVERVVEPIEGRIDPPCPYVAPGCGGCSWQHVDLAVQRQLKRQIVRDALQRVGGVPEPALDEGPALADFAYRTTLRLAVVEDRVGYRRPRSHDVLPVTRCLVAHPYLEDVIRDARFPGASEVVLRCSAATGERIARVEPVAATAHAEVPPGVDVDRTAFVHEDVAGHRLRVSSGSFFQSRADGAAALVAAVAAAAQPFFDADQVVDAYAGVGLFAACLPLTGRLVAVESSRDACRDARHNLAGRDATVLRREIARWEPAPARLVIADPPRTGLGRSAAERLVATGAERIVLVSCDPVAMARDVGLLRVGGYRHRRATLIDLFPHTPHVEAVTILDRDHAIS